MSNIERKLPHDRWDRVWKFFCTPELPHGRWFLQKLLGEKGLSYKLDIAELQSLSTESVAVLEGLRADRYILVRVDDEQKTIHLEFQASNDPSMALRTLRYALERRRRVQTDQDADELYVLPDSYIIDVRGTMWKKDQLKLGLVSEQNRVHFQYPIIHALSIFPSIAQMMNCTSVETAATVIVNFARQVEGIHYAQSDYFDFVQACAALVDREVFSVQGASEGKVMSVMSETRKLGQTIQEAAIQEGMERGIEQGMERGLEQGLEQAIRNVMAALGCTRAKAEEIVRGDVSSSSSGSRSRDVSGLDLR